MSTNQILFQLIFMKTIKINKKWTFYRKSLGTENFQTIFFEILFKSSKKAVFAEIFAERKLNFAPKINDNRKHKFSSKNFKRNLHAIFCQNNAHLTHAPKFQCFETFIISSKIENFDRKRTFLDKKCFFVIFFSWGDYCKCSFSLQFIQKQILAPLSFNNFDKSA